MSFASMFSEPVLGGSAVGSKEWFEKQLQLIESRPLTKATYLDWYSRMTQDVGTVPSSGPAGVLELGSGSGFAKTLDPSIITSDVSPGASDLVVDAQQLPFPAESLRAIMMTHVFHHIPNIRLFLAESVRTLIPGGVITIIDVAHTPLSRLLFGRFHPEDYDASSVSWELDARRPVGGANQALSWIVLKRDLKIFEKEFPELTIETFELLPWFAYLCSGGVTKRALVPNVAARPILLADRALTLFNSSCSLHCHIRIRKCPDPSQLPVTQSSER